VLFTQDQDRPVYVIDIKGIEKVQDGKGWQDIKVAAGEDWHDLVLWSLEQGLGGLENLSLIPGKCGAAPIQNIGAYGVELADVIQSVTCMDKQSQALFTLDKQSCEFGYRDSIFKGAYRGKYVITSIVLRLTTSGHHENRISYGAIQATLDQWRIKVPTIKDISAAVILIRQSKLPDPATLPNAGSFFKNPVIKKELYDRLLEDYPDIPSYPIDDLHVKVPAGWLIDKSGWKGIMLDQVGVHNRQALVLVNHGSPDGSKIIKLSKLIADKVLQKYSIQLEREVNIL